MPLILIPDQAGTQLWVRLVPNGTNPFAFFSGDSELTCAAGALDGTAAAAIVAADQDVDVGQRTNQNLHHQQVADKGPQQVVRFRPRFRAREI